MAYVAVGGAIAYGVMVAAAVAGTTVSIIQAQESAAVQKKTAELAEDVAKYNAKVAQNNAIAAADQASYESRQIRRRNVQLLGKQRATAAKSGVLIDGSVAALIDDTAIQAEMDRLAAIYTGALQGNFYGSQAALSNVEAGYQRFVGGRVNTQRNLAIGGALASGAGQAASSYGSYPGFGSTSQSAPGRGASTFNNPATSQARP